jgi:hypothetical protein
LASGAHLDEERWLLRTAPQAEFRLEGFVPCLQRAQRAQAGSLTWVRVPHPGHALALRCR